MTVFASSYASQYDVLYEDKDYAGECDLIAAIVAAHDIAMTGVLDIGCGTGGHSLEWTRRGIASVGVDLSPEMVAIARQKSESLVAGVRPQWLVGDARTFKLPQTFDVATMMFAVLGYMTTNADVLSALRNVRQHLRPGGIFVFDCWYGPAVLSQRPGERVRVVGDDEIKTIRAASTRLDTEHHLAHVTFRLWNIAQDRYLGHSEETHVMRYFFPQELRLLLDVAGFELSEIRSFPDGGAIGDESWNVYCVAVAK